MNGMEKEGEACKEVWEFRRSREQIALLNSQERCH